MELGGSSRELAIIGDNEIVLLKKVSDEEFELFHSHALIVKEYGAEHDLVTLVIRAFDKFTDYMNNAIQSISVERSLKSFSVPALALDASELILNYLNALRIFLDHSEATVKKKFGNDSEQAAFFKESTRVEFDTYFSYGFLYKFRNYCTHCGLPPFHFEILNDHGEIAKLIIFFKPHELLDRYKEWGVDIKRELESYDGNIYVRKVLGENVNCVFNLFIQSYLKLYADTVGQSYRWIHDFLGLKDLALQFAFVTRVDDTSPDQVLNLEWVPMDEIRKVAWVERKVAEGPIEVKVQPRNG